MNSWLPKSHVWPGDVVGVAVISLKKQLPTFEIRFCIKMRVSDLSITLEGVAVLLGGPPCQSPKAALGLACLSMGVCRPALQVQGVG